MAELLMDGLPSWGFRGILGLRLYVTGNTQ